MSSDRARGAGVDAHPEVGLAERRAAVERHQRAAFTSLVRHAWHRSRFYRDLYSASGLTEDDLEAVRPEDLPTVDKKLLMEQFDRVVTDPRLVRGALLRWIDQVADPELDYLDAFMAYHTSGSSGSRGLFVCSRRDWRRAASVMASRLPAPANDGHGKTRAAFCFLSVLDPDCVVVDRLNDFQPHQLHGYAGSIHHLAELALGGALRIAPKRIFVGAEPLTSAMERRIAEAWAVPVHEAYSAPESKFIAHRQSGQARMAVVDELNLLEVLDEANRPVAVPGTGRSVLTNLYNTTQPVIRYELGDVIDCAAGTPESPLKTIAIIPGKVVDTLPISLRDGTPAVIDGITLNLFSVRGLDAFQFVSRPDRVRIVYVGGANLDEAIRGQFRQMLDRRGAAPTAVEIERVARIPVDPKTGKYRRVVREG